MHLFNNPFLAPEARNSRHEQLLGLARDTLIGRTPRHEERNRLFCIAGSWKSFNLFRYRKAATALPWAIRTRYINPRSNGFFLSQLRLFIGRCEKSYFESPRYYPHRESCIASALFVLFVVDAYARGRSSACYIPRSRRTLTFLLLSSPRARPVQSEEESCEPEISNMIKAFACNLLYQRLWRPSRKLLGKFNTMHKVSYDKIIE